MAKPAITKRQTKGSALTYSELDTNFQNLRDATINFTDGVNTLSMDLNDTVTVQGQSTHNMSVTVNEAGNVITVDNLLSDYTFEPTGFENRTDSLISFNSGTRNFVIQPAVTSYRIWTQGEMRVKTATESVQIPDVSDLYYFYFDSSGVLQYTTSPSFQTHCLVAAVQWNAADGDYYFLGEERHGIVMDWATHEYLNKTQGFKYASGLAAINYTTAGTGSSNADAQIDLTSGELYQEDIKVTVTHNNSPTYSNFEQDLQGPGRFPVMYHSGSTGQWKKDAATDFPVKQGTARITYNLNTAGTWTTPDASNNHYVAIWLVATANIKDGPIVALLGQREDVNIDNARTNNTWSSLDLTNFPGQESRPLYRLIFKTGTGYANTPKCYLAEIEDFRTTDVRTAAGGTGAVTESPAFANVAVGATTITADNASGTLTLAAGTSITLSADSGTDTVTINSTASGTVNSGSGGRIAWYSGTGTAVSSLPQVTWNNATSAFTIANGSHIQTAIVGDYANNRHAFFNSTSTGFIHDPATAGLGNAQFWLDGAIVLYPSDVTATGEVYPVALTTKKIVVGGRGLTDNATITTSSNAENLVLNTNSGTNSGTIKINYGTGGNIEIDPSGTGLVVLGGDLNLQTGVIGTTTTNSNIEIEPNGTGVVYLNGPVKTNATTGTPTNTTTPASWLKVDVGGSVYYMPLYQ